MVENEHVFRDATQFYQHTLTKEKEGEGEGDEGVHLQTRVSNRNVDKAEEMHPVEVDEKQNASHIVDPSPDKHQRLHQPSTVSTE